MVAAASAGRVPAPSAAAPPDSSSSSPKSSLEEEAAGRPSSLLPADGKQTAMELMFNHSRFVLSLQDNY